jgi:hypothetical protein
MVDVIREESPAEGLQQLVGTHEGQPHYSDGLAAAQGTAAAQGFSHVSAKWYPKTLSYEQGMEQLEADKKQIEDIRGSLSLMQPDVNTEGKFVLRGPDGREFVPTTHALKQMCGWTDVGTVYPERLNNYTGPADGDMLKHIFQYEFIKLKQKIAEAPRKEDTFIFRTQNGNTLRAMLGRMYVCIDNRFILEILKKEVPGGRLSHWRGDANTLYGNVLIPDTIRVESDSDYGGGITVSNSEIGERRYGFQAWLFRFICMNGCIHDKVEGSYIDIVHRRKDGKIDLDLVRKQTIECIHKQIPLITAFNDAMQSTKQLTTQVTAKPLVAEFALSNKLSKPIASAVLRSLGEEVRAADVSKGTLFGLINASTRAAQKMTGDNNMWVKLEEAAGIMTAWTHDDWDKFTKRAALLSAKKVDDVFTMNIDEALGVAV